MLEHKNPCFRLVEKIIREIGNLPSGPFWIRDVVVEKRYSFPIFLSVGDGKQIHITPEIDGMLTAFSRALMDEYFASHKSEFTNSEWVHIVKGAFGASLVNHDKELGTEEDAKKILAVVRNTIHDRIRDIQEREHIFGCHVCNIPDFTPLSIGPVCFEPRLAWLARIQSRGIISKRSRLRIERAWQGMQLRKRKPSMDQLRESSILDAIGKGDFVCSVAVGPMGAEAGLQKALTAARLATTVISLAWNRPSSILKSMTLAFDR